MAKVVFTKKIVMVEKEIKEPRVHLDLSTEQAQTLLEILGKVGGDPNTSVRCFSDHIYNQLLNLGFKHVNNLNLWNNAYGSPGIYFSDQTFDLINEGLQYFHRQYKQG